MALTAAHINAMLKAAGASTTNLIMPASKIADAFNDAMIKYGGGKFTTVDRVAALISESMMESAYFRTATEYRPSSTGWYSWQQRYKPYIGRTAIQVTWRDNYAKFGAWAKSQKLITDANLFVDHPTRLAETQWFALGPIWYFTKVTFHGKPLYEYASNIDHVGKAVNLGNPYSSATANGAAERRRAFAAVRSVGKSIIPSGQPSGSSTGSSTTTVAVQPTAGKIMTPFGKWGSSWSWNRKGNQGQHGGDDWHTGSGAADIGNKIISVAAGKVIYAGDATRTGAGWGKAFGKHVLIKWDQHGRTSIDAHMSKISVKTGDRVKVGQKIGEVGATGNVSGPHDHHEQHKGTLWTSPRVKPIYPGRTVAVASKIEQEHLDMATQQPIKTRTKAVNVKPTKNGKTQVLRLDDKGNVSWAFGGGKYMIDLNLRFKNAGANDELMVRAIYVDLKNGKPVGKAHTFPWVGLSGSAGKTWRTFSFRRHIPAKAGVSRRLRIELANWSKKTIIIERATTVVWKAPL